MENAYKIIEELRLEITELKRQLVNATRINGELNAIIDRLELTLAIIYEHIGKK